MADVRTEPSMEDILASIKRIIADDGETMLAAPRPAGQDDPADADRAGSLGGMQDGDLSSDVAAPHDDFVLELTEPVAVVPAGSLVSPDAANASRQSLAALSKMVVRPEPESGNTLEALVRELLRPVLKEWLDAKLPEMVEGLVAREIARITGKAL